MKLNVNRFLMPFLKHPVAFPVTCSLHDLKGDPIGQGYNQPADIVAYEGKDGVFAVYG
jgi:hypothetical protein